MFPGSYKAQWQDVYFLGYRYKVEVDVLLHLLSENM